LANAGGFSEMKRINPIILFLAGIGFCAAIYGGWHYYQEKRAAAQNQAVFSAPYSGDTFNPKNNAPPPPQH
jgi:hypothetical protein